MNNLSISNLNFKSLFSINNSANPPKVNRLGYKQNSDTNTYLPYQDEIEHYKLGYTVPFLSAAGGMKINIYEMSRYMMMHMNWQYGHIICLQYCPYMKL